MTLSKANFPSTYLWPLLPGLLVFDQPFEFQLSTKNLGHCIIYWMQFSLREGARTRADRADAEQSPHSRHFPMSDDGSAQHCGIYLSECCHLYSKPSDVHFWVRSYPCHLSHNGTQAKQQLFLGFLWRVVPYKNLWLLPADICQCSPKRY